MATRLDSIDAQIVSLLHEDGRMSSTEIVRRIGYVTERIVRHRIKRLVDEGVIRVRAIVNPPAIGYAVTADVWLQTDATLTTQVAAQLTQLDQVSYVSYSTGEQNISLQLHAVDLPELHHLVNEVISRMPGVRRATISIIPCTLKDIDQWEIPPQLISK